MSKGCRWSILAFGGEGVVGETGVFDGGGVAVEGEFACHHDPVAAAEFEEVGAAFVGELGADLRGAAVNAAAVADFPREFELAEEDAAAVGDVPGLEVPADLGLVGDLAEGLLGQLGGGLIDHEGDEVLPADGVSGLGEGEAGDGALLKDEGGGFLGPHGREDRVGRTFGVEEIEHASDAEDAEHDDKNDGHADAA